MKAKSKSKKSRKKKQEDSPSHEDIEDLSHLRKPIDTSLTSLRKVTELFDSGSDEVKAILTYECEIIYECRICRSLFRSLGNLISHKRVYCTTKFSVSFDEGASGPSNTVCYQAGAETDGIDLDTKENCKINKRTTKNRATKKVCKNDLTSVVDMLQNKHTANDLAQKSPIRIVADNQQVLLEVIDKSKVAYQTVLKPCKSDIDKDDLMKAQATELQSLLDKDTAILGPDGHLIQIDDEEEQPSPLFQNNNESELSSKINLTCSICNTQFSTKKTLTFHMKTLHTPHRTVYPCIFCESFFSNPWSTYRHLMKIHKKTNIQVRKLRAQILRGAFVTESTLAKQIEKNAATQKAAEVPVIKPKDKPVESLDSSESDKELHRCGGCDKKFERKAALASHIQICKKIITGRSDASTKAKRRKASSEIVIETSTTLPIVPSPILNKNGISVKGVIPSVIQSKQPSEDVVENEDVIRLPSVSSSVTITRLPADKSSENAIPVHGIETLRKHVWDNIGTGADCVKNMAYKSTEEAAITSIRPIVSNNTKPKVVFIQNDDPKIIFANIEQPTICIAVNRSRKRKMGKNDLTKISSYEFIKRSRLSLSNRDRSPTPDDNRPVSSRVTAVEREISAIADLKMLRCLPCNTKFSNMVHLRRHMAIHINWNRYHCKICDFKCFEKVDCVAHCNKNHNAKNYTCILDKMIAELPLDNATYDRSNGISEKQDLPVNSSDSDVFPVTKPATSSDDLASGNKEMNTIQNGVESPDKHHNSRKRSVNNDSSCSESEEICDSSIINYAKGKSLDDPELRRMVLEVIIGPCESTTSQESPENTTSQEFPESTTSQESTEKVEILRNGCA